MNKKKYIALIQEYENIIEDKQFNTQFYNIERFEELKTLIIRQLSDHQKKCMLEIASRFRYGMDPFPSNKFEFQLMKAKDMYAPLMNKIEHEESIQGYEYESCYIELHFGFLKLKQVLPLCLAYGGFIIVKWCLGYFGLLS